MTEEEFIKYFENDTPMLEAWGRFVAQAICDKLSELLQLPATAETFIKVPIIPRVKTVESAIDKVFIRKCYNNPDEDLTDKVGVRFVVLLTRDIYKVIDAVESIEYWMASKDRDYEKEQEQNPEYFTYQSVHFVVRANKALTIGEIAVPVGTPCEVQIRSLMQHAYSELTHDTIYKPKAIAAPQVKRYMARSMALIETTDELFCAAREQIDVATRPEDNILIDIKKLYESLIGERSISTKTDLELIDTYREKIMPETTSEIHQFYQDKPALVQLIKDRRVGNILYRQAAILIVYYLVSVRRKFAKAHWPLGSREKDLEQIFTDLGYSYTND